MKVGLYSPYFNILGGGEKYLLTIAEVLGYDHHVEVIVPPGKVEFETQKERVHNRFADLDLHKVHFIRGPFSGNESWRERSSFTKQYDMFFYVTDGSFFWSRAKKNIVIIQSPDTLDLSRLMDRIKLSRWKVKLCYSRYVQHWLEYKHGFEAKVLPPAIDPAAYTMGKKENVVIAVGRFSRRPHDKKQLRMIRAFKDMIDDGLLTDWKFIMMGGLSQDDHDYYQQVVMEAKGYPIEVHANSGFELLLENYSKAKIYWHATGFEEDLQKLPERAEHFGITTLEAMASGAVPVVVNAGGQPEIVWDGHSGFLWESIEELKMKTMTLVNDEHRRDRMAISARKKSFDFDKKTFRKKLYEVLL
jgi:glycosyltransferase involved in cell wall biosynthesis